VDHQLYLSEIVMFEVSLRCLLIVNFAFLYVSVYVFGVLEN